MKITQKKHRGLRLVERERLVTGTNTCWPFSVTLEINMIGAYILSIFHRHAWAQFIFRGGEAKIKSLTLFYWTSSLKS